MKLELNIPNIITISRALLVPFICYFLYFDNLFKIIIAIFLLLIASLTDTFDGIIARKLNQTTEFGAFFDPLADKILIWGVYLGFLVKPFFNNMWFFILLIIIRDIFVTFLRYHSKKQNIKFKTSFLAKTKTAVQMIIAFVLMFFLLVTYFIKSYYKVEESSINLIWNSKFPEIANIVLFFPFLLIISVSIFTVFTGLDYFLQYLKERRKS